MEFFPSDFGMEPCALCGSSRLEINEELTNSGEDKTVSKFCSELQVFWSYYYGGGGGDSSIKLESLSVCETCGALISGALRRKDNIVRVEDGVRKLEEKLRKERNELKWHLDKFLKEMRKIRGMIGSEAPEAYQEDGEDLQGVIKQVIHHFQKDCQDARDEKTCQSLQESPTKMEIPEDYQLSSGSPGWDDDLVKVEMDSDVEAAGPDEDPQSPSTDDDNEEGDDWQPGEVGSDEDNCEEGEDNYFEDDDPTEDFEMKGNRNLPKPVKVKDRLSKPSSFRKMDSIKTRGMTKFKKWIVRRALTRADPERIAKRKAQYFNNKKKDEFFVEDPSQNLDYYMEYSSEHDCLFIKDIKINILEKPASLSCSQCPYSVPRYPDREHYMDHLMYEHVTSRHLHVFQCPTCGKDNRNYTRYKYHMNHHRSLYKCDICGKPLTRKFLPRHRWTHMSAEEVEESKRKGVKDPRQQKPNQQENSFQCATCGKSFNTKGKLTAHEKRHDKKMVVCPTCGKEIWERHFNYHVPKCEVSIKDQGRPPAECPHCQKGFPTLTSLKGHIKRLHTEAGLEKRFLCEICSKGFTQRTALKNHMTSVHSEARPFECEKGCGTSFKTKTSWKRHHKVCTGHGTKPGRVKGSPWKKNKS